MKTLIVLRHGKAGPYARDVAGDKARALTERGVRDATTMGRLIGTLVQPDLVVSSDAVRARQTAEIAAETFGYKGEVMLEPAIYQADLDELIDIVRKLPASADVVVIAGHNPGFSELSWALAPEGTPPVELPTAAFAHFRFSADKWRDVRPGTGDLIGIHSPKGERES
ncbi:MAG: histidine phosphatase family protein [Chloroflexia bacterium]